MERGSDPSPPCYLKDVGSSVARPEVDKVSLNGVGGLMGERVALTTTVNTSTLNFWCRSTEGLMRTGGEPLPSTPRPKPLNTCV